MGTPIRPERPRRRKQQGAEYEDDLAALAAEHGVTPSPSASSVGSQGDDDDLAVLAREYGVTPGSGPGGSSGNVDLRAPAPPITDTERGQMRRMASLEIPGMGSDRVVPASRPAPLPTSTIRPGPARSPSVQADVQGDIAERTLGRYRRTREPEPMHPRAAQPQAAAPMTLDEVFAKVRGGVAPRDALRPDPRTEPPKLPTIGPGKRPTKLDPAALAQLAQEARQRGIYENDPRIQALADKFRAQAINQSDREDIGGAFLTEALGGFARTGSLGMVDPQRGPNLERERLIRESGVTPEELEASGLLDEDERKPRPALLGEEGDDLKRMAGGFAGSLVGFGPGLLAERAALGAAGRATLGADRTAKLTGQLTGASLPSKLARGALEGQGVGSITEGVAAAKEGRDVGNAITQGIEANALLGAAFEGAGALLSRVSGRSPRGGATVTGESRRAPTLPQDAATGAPAIPDTPARLGASSGGARETTDGRFRLADDTLVERVRDTATGYEVRYPDGTVREVKKADVVGMGPRETAAASAEDAIARLAGEVGASSVDPLAFRWTEAREKELRQLAKRQGVSVEFLRKQIEEHHEFQVARSEGGRYKGRDANMKAAAAAEGRPPLPRSSDSSPEGIQRVPVSDLAIDAARFQFKLNTDEQGAGRELKSVKKWNPQAAGVVSVWRDPKDGRTYVVNGHHRADLAKRLGVGHLNVQYIDAPTAEAARAAGAVLNIAEGRGTALDAAKFFRDTGYGPAQLAEEGVSLSGAVAKNGLALSRLAPDVFSKVATGKVHERHGVILGDVLGDSPAMQRAAASIIEGAARTPTDAQVYEIAQQVRGAGEAKFTQEGLFGADTIDESLILQRSEVAAELRKRLEGDKRLFGFVTKGDRAEALARGGNTIDVAQSGKLAESAAIFSETFGREAHSAGPVGRLITDAARRVANGERAKAVAEHIYEQVRAALQEALAGRGALRGTGLEARDANAGRLPAGPDAARGQGAGGASAEGAAGAEGLEGRVRDSDDPAQGGTFDPTPGAMARELMDSLEPGSLLDDQLGDANAPLGSPSRITRRPRGAGERLDVAAVRLVETGQVFEGRTTVQAMIAAEGQGFRLGSAPDRTPYEFGFVTSTGRFVEEREAVGLAFKAGQLRKNTRLYKALASGVIPIDFKERHVEPHQLKGMTKRTPLIPEPVVRGAILPLHRPPRSLAEVGQFTKDPAGYIEAERRYYREAGGPPISDTPSLRARAIQWADPESGEVQVTSIERFSDPGEAGRWSIDGKPIHVTEGYLDANGEFLTRAEAEARYASASDVGPEGRDESGALFSPADDDLTRLARQHGVEEPRREPVTDLFGNDIPDEGDDQTSMFGGKEGTAAARSLAQAEAAARGELDVLRTRLALETDAAKRAQTAKRIAELDRLVNRDKAIGADELRARAAAGELTPDVPDDFPPPGPDQGVLLSPASDAMSALGFQLRKALGLKASRFDDVKALSSIAKGLAEAVGVPLRQGRGNLKRMSAEGAFWVGPEVIRVRRIRKLDTVAHEVGHYLSKKYGLKEMAKALGKAEARRATAELVQMGKDLYGSRKPAGGYAEEGVAQWARFYVTDPARLQQDAPTFAPFMETVLANEPALKGALDTAREGWEAYQAAPAAAKMDAMMAIGHKQFFRASWRAFVRYALDDLTDIQAEVESLGGVEAISKDAYKLARLTRGDAGKALDMAERGVIDFTTRQRVSRGLREILADVGEDRWQEFRRYLVAERALEKAAQGVDTGVDSKAAAELVAAGRADPVLWKAAGEVWDYSNALLAYLRDAGLMTPDEWAAIQKNNQRRVPFYRVIDPNETGTLGGMGGGGKRMAQNSSGLHALKGSDRPIIDPLESLLADTYNIVSRAEKHAAAVALVRQALATDGGGRVVELLPEIPREKVSVRLVDVADQLAELGFTVPDDLPNDKIAEMSEAVLSAFYPKKRAGLREAQDLVMPILMNGQRKWVQIKDRTLWKALADMETVPRALLERLAEIPNRVLRAGATLSPDFIGTNPIRDAFTTAIYSQAPGIRPPGAHFAEGVFHLFKKDELYQRWLQEGGMNAGLVGFDQRAVQAALAEMKTGKWAKVFRPVTSPIRSLAAVAEFMENSNRLGEFAAVYRDRLAKGMPEVVAAKQGAFSSRELLDFARAGVAGRWANKVIAFINANVQDLDKLRREMLFSDPKRRAEVLFRATAYLTVPSVMMHLAQMDDEAYQDIPEAVKATGWVWVQRGDDGEVAHIWWIPRPHILGVLFGYLPTKVMDYIEHDDPTSLRQAAEGIALVATPPWMPTFAKPIYDIARNKDFRDRPIVPRALEGLAPEMQAQRWTGETVRVLGEWTGTSPAKLEYLVQGYTGGLGRYATDIADAAIREGRELTGRPPLKPRDLSRPDKLDEIPLVGRFVQKEPGSDAQSVRDVYDAYQAAEEKRRTWRRLLREGRKAEAKAYRAQHIDEIRLVATEEETGSKGVTGPLRAAHERFSDLAEMKRAVLNSRAGEAYKQRRLRELDDRLIQAAHRYRSRQQQKATKQAGSSR